MKRSILRSAVAISWLVLILPLLPQLNAQEITNSSRVTIRASRPSQFVGYAITTYIKVNGAYIGSLANGQTVSLNAKTSADNNCKIECVDFFGDRMGHA